MALDETKFDALLKAICDKGKEILINTGSESVENVLTLVDNIQKLEGGDRQGDISSRAQTFKDNYSNTIAGALQSELTSLFNDYQDFIGAKTNARWPAAAAHALILQHFIDNTKSVLRRNPSYDTSATEVGTGDHTIYRLTEDQKGIVIENSYLPLDIVLEIQSDQQDNIARFEEPFRFQATPQVSLLDNSAKFGGSSLPLLSPRNRDGPFISNHSWQLGQSSAAAIADPQSSRYHWKSKENILYNTPYQV